MITYSRIYLFQDLAAERIAVVGRLVFRNGLDALLRPGAKNHSEPNKQSLTHILAYILATRCRSYPGVRYGRQALGQRDQATSSRLRIPTFRA